MRRETMITQQMNVLVYNISAYDDKHESGMKIQWIQQYERTVQWK